MVLNLVEPVPAVTVETPKRITSHSSLSEIVKVFQAPPIKETRMKPVNTWEKNARTRYYVSRMETYAKSAQSPDMNLTLKEIQTGERIVDKIAVSLFAYTVGVFFLFFLLF